MVFGGGGGMGGVAGSGVVDLPLLAHATVLEDQIYYKIYYITFHTCITVR